MGKTIFHSGLNNFFRNDEVIRFSHGNGHVIYDTNLNSYIDFILGFGPVIIGHNNPIFQKEFLSYLGNGIMMPGYTKWHSLFLEKFLKELSNYSAIFFKTASEAILGAIRLSSLITGKKGIIRCGYIGWHDIQLVNSVKWHEPLNSPYRYQIRHANNPYENNGLRSYDSNEPILNWVDFDLTKLDEIIKKNHEKIGSFIIDTFQIFFSDLNTIRKAIDICHLYNIKVIFDETKTGGRISKHGYAIDNKLDVDLIVLGKSLANGCPISLIIGDQGYLKHSEIARISGTFSKEMVSIYAALATLDFLQSHDGYNQISKVGDKIITIFNSCINESELDSIISVKSVFNSSMFDISFAKQILPLKEVRSQLVNSLIKNGILLLQGHPSFICYDHLSLDSESFKIKFTNGLNDWKNYILKSNLKIS